MLNISVSKFKLIQNQTAVKLPQAFKHRTKHTELSFSLSINRRALSTDPHSSLSSGSQLAQRLIFLIIELFVREFFGSGFDLAFATSCFCGF